MDSQYGGIQWIQHSSVNHHTTTHHVVGASGGGRTTTSAGDMKTAGQLVIDPQPPCEEDLMASANSSSDYIATEEDDDGDTTNNIDQIAAENLIFMARDGQMVAEIINTNGTDKNGAVVMTTSDGEQIDCDAIMEQAALIQQHEDTGGGGDVYTVDHYTETTPQMVTEEVITDDWVQHQGEERVEISAEQIISNSQVIMDIEVPLPTVQDEYTALRPYPCDFCSRRFRKKASLMNHMVAHQNDRPHLCKLCGLRFMRRQDLINHLKAHAEEEPASDPQMDDSDFIHFVTDTTSSSQRTSNDHYYEQDWSVPEDSVTIPIKSSRKQYQQHQQQSTSNHNHSSGHHQHHTVMGNSVLQMPAITSVSSVAITTAPPRGRISRLKPKEDAYVVNVANNCAPNNSATLASSFSIVQCDALPNNTIEFTQDPSPASLQVPTPQHLQRSQQQQLQQKQVLHFPIIDDNKPFVCQQCGLAFSRQKALLSHTKTHRNDSPFECPQCNEIFWDQTSLTDHQRTHQFEESNSEYDPNEGEDDTQSESESEQQLYGEFYCSECGMSFHRQDLLRRHAKSHAKPTNNACLNSISVDNSKDQHCCNTCGETFAEALDLLAHAEIHARFPPFKCVLCGESFFEEPTIKKHLQSQHAHEMTENSCILCGKECRDRKALIKHAWDHSREKCHSCSKCGKNFHNKARLKRHMASHRDKSVQCDVCHEEFPDGRTLSNHRHSHSTTSAGKLFPCNECGKTFGSRSSQQIHVRIHTGERPYGCRFCWKAFADGGTLRKHERIHTGEKPYACSVCPRAFNQRVVLREHIRSHHSGLDTKRGTYYCTVCGADLSSSGDLIQHLIQHSDNNTAMQRQPVTGPRKYKRRRKLKPHELARLKRDSKQNGGNSSDIDLSDFDMDNVDDLLAMTETNTSTENATCKSEHEPLTEKSTRQKTISSDITLEAINNQRKKSSSSKKKSQIVLDPDDFDLDVGLDGNGGTGTGGKKARFNSTSSDKIWSTKPSNEETYKSLLSNLETTLQSIDTLVVGPSSNNLDIVSPASGKRKSKHESTAQRTQQVQIVRNEVKESGIGNGTTASKGRKGKADKAAASKTKGPQMIRTEKCTISSVEGGRKKSKSVVTRTQTTSIEMPPKSVGIVDDYDIISPALHPPKQISCSPLHIKQEHHEHQILMKTHHHPNVLAPNSGASHRNQTSSTRHNNDIYDAHLLLEASGLRTDLDEILRSPMKSDKLSGSRQRFTSESSTQFLNEQSEEEQHLIKIEPTSPDLREIVNGVSSVNTSEVVVTTAGMELNVSSGMGTQSRKNSKAARSQKNSNASNRKYFEFSNDHLNAATKTASNQASSSHKRNSAHSNLSMGGSPSIKASKAARTEAAKPSKVSQNAASFFSYGMVENFNAVPSSSLPNDHHHHNANSFASISAVVSAADATAAAAAQQNPTASRKRQRYFECEMCSAVFSDRAQLLDHVPIHI